MAYYFLTFFFKYRFCRFLTYEAFILYSWFSGCTNFSQYSMVFTIRIFYTVSTQLITIKLLN